MNWKQAARSTLAALAGAAITLETIAIPVWARAVCAGVIAAAAAAHITPSAAAEVATAAAIKESPWT